MFRERPWGHPDLRGNWNAATLTPLERPDNVGGRLSLSPAKAAAIERAERERVWTRALPSDPNRNAPPVGANVGGCQPEKDHAGSKQQLENW